MDHEDIDVDLEVRSTLRHVGSVLLVGELLAERDEPVALKLERSGGLI